MAVSVRRRFDFGGGNPMVFFEGITEMPDILIAQQVGCFINLAVGSKQFPGLIHFQPGDIAVSYTHLDVYKRQVWRFYP